jgi:RHS repeat-associated protein
MTTRGSQTLTYDAQNQLVRSVTTNDTVLFGYDDSGQRLYRAGTNGYTVWIGGIYEINNGKVLCHVYAGGQLVATFEPQCNAGLSRVFGEKNWYVVSTTAQNVLSWPFAGGRGRWTFFGGTWLAIIGGCLLLGRRVPFKRHELRRVWRPASLWRMAVTLGLISAFLAGGIGEANAAPVYNPVFYYYHTDHLGSSNVLTDRSGNVVQHYGFATFGQMFYQQNTSAFPVSNRYTGQIADDETGLYYYGGRYYDPQLGRFIQPDPMVPDPTDSQSLNRYSYCGNNPLNEIDPTGFDDSSGGDSSGGTLTIGNNGYGVTGIDGNGSFFATWTWYDQPLNSPLDYNSINSLLNSGLQSSSFDSLGDASSGFGAIPPVSTGPTQGSGGNGWLTAGNAVLNVASLVPGPVGAIASGVQAGLDLVQGHYLAAGISVAGIALSFVGLGVAAKAIRLAREARLARNAESLAVDAAKAANAAGIIAENSALTGKASKELAQSLLELGQKPFPAAQAAHIVPTLGHIRNDEEAVRGIFTAQNKMDTYLEGMRNHAINGFWEIPGHSGTHTDVYYRALGQEFKDVGSSEETLQALDRMRARITAGEF